MKTLLACGFAANIFSTLAALLNFKLFAIDHHWYNAVGGMWAGGAATWCWRRWWSNYQWAKSVRAKGASA